MRFIAEQKRENISKKEKLQTACLCPDSPSISTTQGGRKTDGRGRNNMSEEATAIKKASRGPAETE